MRDEHPSERSVIGHLRGSVERDGGIVASTGEPWDAERDPSAEVWELWRQDDNGARVRIDTFADRAEAERRQAELEARGHKQTYWVERRDPGRAG